MMNRYYNHEETWHPEWPQTNDRHPCITCSCQVFALCACFITSKELPEVIKKTFLSFQLNYFTTVNYRESKMVVLSEFQEGKAEIYMLTI